MTPARIWFSNLRGHETADSVPVCPSDWLRRESRDFSFLEHQETTVEYLFPDGARLDAQPAGTDEAFPVAIWGDEQLALTMSANMARFARDCLGQYWSGEAGEYPQELPGWWEYRDLNRYVARALADRIAPERGDRIVVGSPLLLHTGHELRLRGIDTPLALLLDVPFGIDSPGNRPFESAFFEAFSAYDEIAFLADADRSMFRRWFRAGPRRLLEDGENSLCWRSDSGVRRLKLRVIPPHPPKNPSSEDSPTNPGLGKGTIVSIDPLIPQRGIVQSLLAFERLLEQFPECEGEVRFEQVILPGLGGETVDDALRQTVKALVRSINARFGTADWQPVTYRVAASFEDQLSSIAGADALNCLRGGSGNLGRVAIAWQQRDGHLPSLVTRQRLHDPDPHDEDILPDTEIDRVAARFLEALSLSPAQRREQYHRILARNGPAIPSEL